MGEEGVLSRLQGVLFSVGHWTSYWCWIRHRSELLYSKNSQQLGGKDIGLLPLLSEIFVGEEAPDGRVGNGSKGQLSEK